MINILFSSDRDIAEFIGKRLRQYRTVAGLTRQEVADRMGVSLSTVRNIEKGVSGTIDHLVAYLRASGRIEQINALVEAPQLSPLMMAKVQKPFAQRVRKKKDSRK